MAATQPQERRRAEEPRLGCLDGAAQLPQRPADVARVRSRDDKCNKM